MPWHSRQQRLRPAALALAALWFLERALGRLGLGHLSWRCYGLREQLMERSCFFCRRLDLAGGLRSETRDSRPGLSGSLSSLTAGDYAHTACTERHRDAFARLRYPLL